MTIIKRFVMLGFLRRIWLELNDKVAVVTGASRGIGRQIALAFAEAGAHVAVAARSRNPLEKVAVQIEQTGRKALLFVGDISKEKEIRDFIQKTMALFGKIDILVNNAGVGYFAPAAELSTARWDEMFNLNVRGAFLMTREALPYLRKSGDAVVVNLVSLAGKNAFIGGSGYAASKHALLGFSRCLMLEERKNGIRVLAVCPGSVDTHFFDNSRSQDLAPSPEKMLKPQDIAQTILHMIQLPQRAMVSEIDIRPANP